nr:MAG TPA: hypothetical protein [Caudoviricetes sp.]
MRENRENARLQLYFLCHHEQSPDYGTLVIVE